MDNKVFLILSLITLSGFFLFGCTEESPLIADDTGATSEGINSVVGANNRFALDLYSNLRNKEDGNVFFSPYSISTAFAITYEGARGKTADEIHSTFYLPSDDGIRRPAFASIYNKLNKQGKEYELYTANALWVEKTYVLLPEYTDVTLRHYAANVTNVDFISDLENSRIAINNWVERQTKDKVKDLIRPGDMDELTRLVITNAIYFKGTWLREFDKQNTKEDYFAITPEEKVKVQMMKLAEPEMFNYVETEELRAIELPYDGDELSMLVILPKDNNLDAIEASFTAERLAGIRESLGQEEVLVHFPKFKLKKRYSLLSNLGEMGMPTAFSMAADFSGMDGTKDLFITNVLHQAFVEVNEEGTEAAAATAVVESLKSAAPASYKTFKADHPFIFLIQENESGNILFLGRITNPNQ
ncbi:MAG: serpin family protein [Candidatus Micrarchaeota archaeon]